MCGLEAFVPVSSHDNNVQHAHNISSCTKSTMTKTALGNTVGKSNGGYTSDYPGLFVLCSVSAIFHNQ